MRRGWILAIAAAVLVMGGSLPARAGSFGVGAGLALPTGDFGDAVDLGYGLHAMVKHPVAPLVTLTGDAGWTRFSTSDEFLVGEGLGGWLGADDTVDVWNVTGGARVAMMPMNLGLEFGYFSELEEWSLVPNLGFGFSKLALDLRYKATGDAKWFEVRAGLYF
ncbi:MAG: hypothetical protein R6X35_03590 [Candidatus Krumholzibacteriia bacterium]